MLASAVRKRTVCQKLFLPQNADPPILFLHVCCFCIPCTHVSTSKLIVAREDRSQKLNAMSPMHIMEAVSRGAGWNLRPNDVSPYLCLVCKWYLSSCREVLKDGRHCASILTGCKGLAYCTDCIRMQLNGRTKALGLLRGTEKQQN